MLAFNSYATCAPLLIAFLGATSVKGTCLVIFIAVLKNRILALKRRKYVLRVKNKEKISTITEEEFVCLKRHMFIVQKTMKSAYVRF